MKVYRDTETGEIVTEEQLRAEFDELKREQPEEYTYTFAGYIRNITDKNGMMAEITLAIPFNSVPEALKWATTHKLYNITVKILSDGATAIILDKNNENHRKAWNTYIEEV